MAVSNPPPPSRIGDFMNGPPNAHVTARPPTTQYISRFSSIGSPFEIRAVALTHAFASASPLAVYRAPVPALRLSLHPSALTPFCGLASGEPCGAGLCCWTRPHGAVAWRCASRERRARRLG